ncbi:hypothetical protein ACSW29_16630 [Rhodococcus sp. GB-02]
MPDVWFADARACADLSADAEDGRGVGEVRPATQAWARAALFVFSEPAVIALVGEWLGARGVGAFFAVAVRHCGVPLSRAR